MAPKQENFDDEKVGLVRDFPLMFFSPISYIVPYATTTHVLVTFTNALNYHIRKEIPYEHKIYLDPHQILLLLW